MKSRMDRFNEKWTPEPTTGCHLWTAAISGSGYGKFKSEKGLESAHRYIYRMTKGEIPNGHDVCHKCDVRICVNPDHLFVGTRSENILDAVNKGRFIQKNGSENANSRLKESDVLLIRESTESNRSVAKRFGVSHTTIRAIKNREMWRHI